MSVDSAFAAPWIFIIDTDQYAGNFERDMCAYCTGMIGQCEVGEAMLPFFKEAFEIDPDKFYEDNPFMDYVDIWVMDDQGCGRPASLWGDPEGSSCNSVAIFFQQEPTEEHIKIMKERSTDFAKNRPDQKEYQKTKKPMKILGFRLLKQTVTTTELSV